MLSNKDSMSQQSVPSLTHTDAVKRASLGNLELVASNKRTVFSCRVASLFERLCPEHHRSISVFHTLL